MASIYDLKPSFQNLLRPITQTLSRNGVTANQVTLTAIVLSVVTGAFIVLRPTARWPLLLVGPMLLLRMALNAIDGMLAREHDMASALGAILNEVGDVVSDSALYLPLALVPGFEPPLVVIAVLLSVLVEMAGVVAVQIGGTRSYRGPMGKSDRAFVLGIVTLLVGIGLPAGGWITIVLVLMVVLLVVTVFNRVRGALQEIPR